MTAGRFNLIGPGRAGLSMRRALVAAGWELNRSYVRGDDVTDAAELVDVCIIAVPDAAIASVAATVVPGDAALVHLSGATPVDVLAPHRRAGLHPLVSLADPEAGATSLSSCFYAIGGDPVAQELAEALSTKWFPISDDDRALYHATAAVASNHLVALLGHVARLAASIDVPVEAFWPLVDSSLGNVKTLGAADALTGPAARGDSETIEAHLAAIAHQTPDELATYEAMLNATRQLIAERNR